MSSCSITHGEVRGAVGGVAVDVDHRLDQQVLVPELRRTRVARDERTELLADR